MGNIDRYLYYQMAMEKGGKKGVPDDAEEAMRAECRQHGRTTPPGSSGPCWRQKRGREAEKRVL
jgi:hypothetical protein